MVAVCVRDDRARDRTPGVDIEIAGVTVEAGFGDTEHAGILRAATSVWPTMTVELHDADLVNGLAVLDATCSDAKRAMSTSLSGRTVDTKQR